MFYRKIFILVVLAASLQVFDNLRQNYVENSMVHRETQSAPNGQSVNTEPAVLLEPAVTTEPNEAQATVGVPAHDPFWQQNASFFEKLPCIHNWVNQNRSWIYGHRHFAHPIHACGEEWAYKHVYKAGGTTSLKQCIRNDPNRTRPSFHGEPEHDAIVSTHDIFTFVRDPIDHFVSGFAECAVREAPEGFLSEAQPTNESIAHYLTTYQGHPCFHHSLPQIEYLLARNSTDPDRYLKRVKYVGDMSQIEPFFRAQGMPWKDSAVNLRHYGDDANEPPANSQYAKKDDYLGLRESLSDDVVAQICSFVKIDYCFFDYTPPEVCRQHVDDFCQRTCPAANGSSEERSLKCAKAKLSCS